MLFEISHNLGHSATLACRQELDLVMKLDDQNVEPVCDRNSYFTDLFGNKVDQKDTYST